MIPKVVAQATGGDTSEDDDIPFSMMSKVLARKWVEKNKINKTIDKTADDYVQRVLLLISSGPSDSAELRTMKARAEARAENGTLDPLLVATEARVYYNKLMRRVEKWPKKTLEHKLYGHLYPSVGMYYLCVWKDVGYADQDVEERKPADYATQFPGLVEDYRKVCGPMLGRALHLTNWCHLVSRNNVMLMWQFGKPYVCMTSEIAC